MERSLLFEDAAICIFMAKILAEEQFYLVQAAKGEEWHAQRASIIETYGEARARDIFAIAESMPAMADKADVPPRAGSRALKDIPTTAAALAVRCGRFHSEAGYAQHDKAGHAFQSRWFGSMRGNTAVAVKEHLSGLEQLSIALREREERRPGSAIALRRKADAIFSNRCMPCMPDGWPAFDTRVSGRHIISCQPLAQCWTRVRPCANDPCAIVC